MKTILARLLSRIGQYVRGILEALFKWANKFVNKRFAFLVPVFALIGAGTVLFWSTVGFWNYAIPEVLAKTKNENIGLRQENTAHGSQGQPQETVGATSGDNSDDGRTDRADGEGRTGIFTAYTSREQETDGDPYTTADGTNLHEVFRCVVASNSLPFGTRIKVEELGICEVHDTGNGRNPENWFDLYMGNDVKRAREFGKRTLQYEILK